MHSGYKDSLRKILEMAKGRKLVFYGTDALSGYVYGDLIAMGHDIEYFVSDNPAQEEFCGRKLIDQYELLYEEKNTIFIAAFVFKDHKKIYKFLIDMGFEFEKDFFLSGFGGYTKKYDAFDSLLGHNRFYGNLLGFEVYGKKNEKSYNVIVLGGSTTDPTVGNVPKCWVKILYEKLYQINSNIVFFNGGMGAYSANQEFYKLIRDGLKLNPAMVISFDGFNDVNGWVTDVEYPHLSKYERKVYNRIEDNGDFAPDTLDLRNTKKIVHGLCLGKKHKDVDEWKMSIRKMHGICKEFGIEYISFLQPMLGTGKAIIEQNQKNLYKAAYQSVPALGELIERQPFFYSGVLKFIQKQEYVHDLTHVFDGKKDMFYDICHNTQYGHEVIAENIFEILKDRIPQNDICGN